MIYVTANRDLCHGQVAHQTGQLKWGSSHAGHPRISERTEGRTRLPRTRRVQKRPTISLATKLCVRGFANLHQLQESNKATALFGMPTDPICAGKSPVDSVPVPTHSTDGKRRNGQCILRMGHGRRTGDSSAGLVDRDNQEFGRRNKERQPICVRKANGKITCRLGSGFPIERPSELLHPRP